MSRHKLQTQTAPSWPRKREEADGSISLRGRYVGAGRFYIATVVARVLARLAALAIFASAFLGLAANALPNFTSESPFWRVFAELAELRHQINTLFAALPGDLESQIGYDPYAQASIHIIVLSMILGSFANVIASVLVWAFFLSLWPIASNRISLRIAGDSFTVHKMPRSLVYPRDQRTHLTVSLGVFERHWIQRMPSGRRSRLGRVCSINWEPKLVLTEFGYRRATLAAMRSETKPAMLVAAVHDAMYETADGAIREEIANFFG